MSYFFNPSSTHLRLNKNSITPDVTVFFFVLYIIYIYNLSQASFRRHSLHNSINAVPQLKSKTICFSSLSYISTVLNGLHQGEWPVTSITHHYYMIRNKFENLHVLQRKVNTRALLPDARPSRPILAAKKSLIFKP